ncbi:hypothetical protein [Kozakia baliensis]|uniref:hypothetical protein n=1 Tax=Kozakia baliensis TaxID=153496 RepID=UPI00049798C0|nr:hypothetical protein [Kozakia baliensis]
MTRQILAHPMISFRLRADKAGRRLLSSHLVPMILLAGLAACSPYAPAQHDEHELALAGFTAHFADTTARWQMMNLLPPHRLTYRMSNLGPVMLYADPLACGCVYFGDRKAYRAYTMLHQQSANTEREMTAENNQHPGWDWSVWQISADPEVVARIQPAY